MRSIRTSPLIVKPCIPKIRARFVSGVDRNERCAKGRGEKAAYLHLMLQICQWFVVQNERVMATRISIKLLGIEGG
jgi:hypothetical protein